MIRKIYTSQYNRLKYIKQYEDLNLLISYVKNDLPSCIECTTRSLIYYKWIHNKYTHRCNDLPSVYLIKHYFIPNAGRNNLLDRIKKHYYNKIIYIKTYYNKFNYNYRYNGYSKSYRTKLSKFTRGICFKRLEEQLDI